jgi:hypothetical protein
LDTKNAAQCIPIVSTMVLPKGTSGFPDGGWLAPAPLEYETFADMSEDQKEELKTGWRVYYEADQPLRMDDVVIFERSFIWPDVNDFHPRMTKNGAKSPWDDFKGNSKLVSTPADAPTQMNGGKAILEVTTENGEAQIWSKIFGGTERKDASWYGTLEEGLKYRYESWVKVDGATGGEVTLGFSDLNGRSRPDAYKKGYFGDTSIMKSFDVSDKWQKVGFEFIAPAAGKDGIEGVLIRYAGDGKLLVDNVKLQPVYEAGDAEKPFVIYQKLFKTIMDNQPATGSKGAVRISSALSSASMESLCDWNSESGVGLSEGSVKVSSGNNSTLAKALTILEATGGSPETRMVPWIITQVTHSEEEYGQLVEYLSAPYNPAKDSPESKPMAYKRTLQRGNNSPWTDDFREIIIEFGNENWHNRAMADWIGFGRYGTVHQAGEEYGLWGKYMIGEMKKSPYWNDEKITITFGGNYSAGVNSDGSVSGYGQEATVAAGGANDYHSHATYVGPRWETGESSQTSIDDSGVQKTLLSYRFQKEDEWAKQSAADKRLREMGFKTIMTAYEGGPSGFGLRAKTPEEDRAGEYYGKSCSMGIAMLDAWLDAWEKGWTYQCYSCFAQGRWWSSHTSFSQGHRASPGFLAQTLINRNMANCDLLKVTVTNSPTITVDIPRSNNEVEKGTPAKTKTVSLIYAHAVADSEKVSVAVFNLDLVNKHSVEIELPITKVSKITAYFLDGDPRDTNLDEEKVTIGEKQISVESLKNGIHKLDLKPGLAMIIVYER